MGYNEKGIIDLLMNLKREDLVLNNLVQRERKLYDLISAIASDGIEDGVKIIMSKMMHIQMANCNLPKQSESAVITLDNPKSAALIFDRVWTPFIKDVPKEVGFFGNTDIEIDVWSCQRIEDIAQGSVSNPELKQRIIKNSRYIIDLILEGELLKANESDIKQFNPEFPYFTLFHRICSKLNSQYNCNVQALLPEEVDFQSKYETGHKKFLYAALKEIAIPDESKLSWEQVTELRNDKEAQKKLRRMIHWVDKELVGKTTEFVKEEIEIKLENYELALRKHSIKTLRGTLGKLIDVDSLVKSALAFGAVSVADVGLNPIYGAAGYLASKILVEFADVYINKKDVLTDPDSAVSYVYDLKKKIQ